eukprot:s3466_g2.t1
MRSTSGFVVVFVKECFLVTHAYHRSPGSCSCLVTDAGIYQQGLGATASLDNCGSAFCAMSKVLWGQQGLSGDSDGALAAARLSAPYDVAIADAQRLLFVTDAGNGKVRVLDLAAGLVSTVATGFLEPKGVLVTADAAMPEVLVADAAGSHVLRIPLPGDLLAAAAAYPWPSGWTPPLASTLDAVPGSVGLRTATGDIFVVEASGAMAVHALSLNGTSRVLLAAGPFTGALANDSKAGAARSLGGRPSGMVPHASAAVVPGIRCFWAPGAISSTPPVFAALETWVVSQGARLCTAAELFDDEAGGEVEILLRHSPCISGSSVVYDGPYDQSNVWSSSTCFVKGTGAPGFMTKSGSRRWRTWARDECREPSQQAFVKCCADRDLVMPMAGMPLHAQAPMWTVPPILGEYVDRHGSGQSTPIRVQRYGAGGRGAFLGFCARHRSRPDVIGLPLGIAWSSTQERLLVADHRGHVLRAVDVLDTGSVDITAGTEGVGLDAGDAGPAVQASFQGPRGLAAVGGVAYVTTAGQRLRRVELHPGGRRFG